MKFFNRKYADKVDIEKIWNEVPQKHFTNRNQVLTYIK